jgi:hypothetical protein
VARRNSAVPAALLAREETRGEGELITARSVARGLSQSVPKRGNGSTAAWRPQELGLQRKLSRGMKRGGTYGSIGS